MGLSRTVNGDFSRKSHIFLTPVYLTPPMKGFPLEFGIGARGQRARMMGATGPRKKFDDIFMRMDAIHERDGRTDGQTDDGKDRAYV